MSFEHIMTVISILFGIVGFSYGVWRDRKANRQSRKEKIKALYLENAQNLGTLDDFWGQVVNTIGDHNDIEKYHRLAYSHLPVWSHLVWENQVPTLFLADEKRVARMYELQRNLDTFLTLRTQMRDAFETDEGKHLWDDFIAWKHNLHQYESLEQRSKANDNRSAIEMRAIAFCSPLDLLWNKINTLYNDIHCSGNPIPNEG